MKNKLLSPIFLSSLLVTSLCSCTNSHKHVFIVKNEVAPTCETEGIKKHYECEICKVYFDLDFKATTMTSLRIPSLGHHYIDVEEKEATCEQSGNIAYSYCDNSNCNKYFDATHKFELSENEVKISAKGHSFIDVSEKMPTCLEDGNSSYSYCETCLKYFDHSHLNNIKENSWVISKLGHDLHIVIEGDYKTNYFDGEVFDKDNVIVKEVCNRENCNFYNLISDYDVIYQNYDNKIHVGDTKVILNINDVNFDINITTNLRSNSIIGMNDNYVTNCQTPIDVKGISATNGNIIFKYFEDSSLTKEVNGSDLRANKTYYLLAKSDGIDKTYEVASKVATVKVEHDLGESSSLHCIGLKEKNCKICGYNIMESSDVDLTNESFSFGANNFSRSNASSEGNTDKVGSLLWATNLELATIKMLFPKVNYKLYKEVKFNFRSSSSDFAKINLGVVQGDDLYTSTSTNNFGSINVKWDNNKLLVSVDSNDLGRSVTQEIVNASISNGNESLRILFKSSTYRSFYLTGVELIPYSSNPIKTLNINGISAPNFEYGRGIDISAYLTPRLTKSNYSKVLTDLKNAGFNTILPLLDGRDSSTDFVNALKNYANSNSSNKLENLDILYSEIDKYCEATKASTDFNVQKAGEYDLQYYVMQEGIYDLNQFSNGLNLSDEDFYLIYKRFIQNINYDGVKGYNGLLIMDEPNSSTLSMAYQASKAYSDLKRSKKAYVNLLPITETQSTYNYSSYIESYMSSIYQYNNFVSFDIYPLLTSNRMLTKHLLNYEIVANKIKNSNSSGKLKAFIHSHNADGDHDVVRSENDLLFEANSALVYGATDIQYFGYSSNLDTSSTTNCLVNSTNYKTSELYDFAKKANLEINNIGKVISSFDWKGVMKKGNATQLGKLSNCLTSFGSLNSISNSSTSYNSLVGCFSNGEQDGFMVMNYMDPRTNTASNNITLNFNTSYKYALIYKDGNTTIENFQSSTLNMPLMPGNSAFIVPFN